MISVFCIAVTFCVLQDIQAQPERKWQTPIELNNQLDVLSTSNNEVSLSTIGFSNNGTPIQCLEIARQGDTPIDSRPAILVVAGIDGGHLLGSAVAVELVQELLSMDSDKTSELLETNRLYIIPQVNPDVATTFFEPVLNEQQKNSKPTDDDHDGLLDEDGGDDLNGDGYITMMRVPDLEKATHLVNPDEPRLHIKPDAFKGQAADFVMYVEGIDNDNDGNYNEDGVGGVDLNKNFMHGYLFHGDGAGAWQLSESESKALADFVLTHQEIATIIVYGHHDTLSTPMEEDGKDKAGAPKKLDEGDVELYKQVSDRFIEITSLKNTTQPNWDGSFVAWAYAQYGVPAFSTPLWSRPEPEQQDDDTTERTNPEKQDSPDDDVTDYSADELTPSGVGDISQETIDELTEAAIAAGYIEEGNVDTEISAQEVETYCKMMGITVRRVKKSNGNTKPVKGEAAWLAYSDDIRGGDGFVEWAEFEHPQLGTVEIGGWVPYFKTLPPVDVIADITKTQAEFIIDLSTKLPDVHFNSPRVTKLSNGLWEIKIAVTNDGWMPSGTSMAMKNKRARPYVIRIDAPNNDIISGQKTQRIWSLQGGGTSKWFTWIVQGQPNSTVPITLYSEKFGVNTIEAVLKPSTGGDK